MTNIKDRLKNILTELSILREALNKGGDYPLCCVTFYADGKISCDYLGPLPKEEFLKECKQCRQRAELLLKQLEKLKSLEKLGKF